MSDDIVTRLNTEEMTKEFYKAFPTVVTLEDAMRQALEAANEIERLREIIQDIANAVTDEGRKPGYHKQQVNYVRTRWFPLWKAISKAVKETTNE